MSPLRLHETSKMLGYYGVLVGIGLMVGVLGPTLGSLGAQTSSSLQQVSLILALRPMGYMAGAVLAGRWMDRHQGHPILVGALLAAAAMLALVPLAGSLALLGACILAMGLAQGLLDVGSTTLLSWVYHGRLGPYLAGLHFSFGLGAFASPLVAAAALTAGAGMGGTFWPLAAFLLPLAAWMAWLPSPQRPHAQQSTEAPPLDKGLAALFVVFFFLYGGVESGFGTWVFQYAVDLKVATAERAAVLSSLFWGLLGLGRLLGIPIMAKVSPGRLLAVLLPASLLSLLAVLLWPGHAVALWTGTAGFGLFMACIFPALIVHAGRLLGRGHSLSGRTTSFFFLGSSSGSMTLPWLMGQAFEPWGPRLSLGLGVISLLGMATVFLVLQRHGKERPLAPHGVR